MEFLPQGAFPGSVPACFQKADEDKTVGGLFVCPPPLDYLLFSGSLLSYVPPPVLRCTSLLLKTFLML